jgi:hypothetical protein
MTERPDLCVALSSLHVNLSESAELLHNLRFFSLRNPSLRLYEAQLLEIRAVVCSELAERITDREMTAAARHERKRKRLKGDDV